MNGWIEDTVLNEGPWITNAEGRTVFKKKIVIPEEQWYDFITLIKLDDSVSGLDYQAFGQLHGKLTQRRTLRRNSGSVPKQTNTFYSHDKLSPMERRHLRRWQSSDMLHNLSEPAQEKDNNRGMPKTSSVSEGREKLPQKRLRFRKMIMSGVLKSWRQKTSKAAELPRAEEFSRIPPVFHPSLVENVILQVSKSDGTTVDSQHPGQQSKVSSMLNYTAIMKNTHLPQIQCKTDIQTTGVNKNAFPQFKLPINKNGKPIKMIRDSESNGTGKIFSSKRIQKLDMSLPNKGKSKRHGSSLMRRRAPELKTCDSVEIGLPMSKAGSSIGPQEDSEHWFDSSDIEKMKLLANGAVIAKARVPGHGQVIKVGLSLHSPMAIDDLMEYCQQGPCGLIKRPSDLNEVLAFHLDRVLGLNRSLPVVARRFSEELLPYSYTNGAVRPIVWWDADIQHMDDPDNDQNSFALSWSQYQAVLRRECNIDKAHGNHSQPCPSVRHSEWGMLALFDFLLQVHDRLDRHCCGFNPETSEPCVEDLLHEKCDNLKEQLLVHILVRKHNPSQLIYIDNSGRLLQAQDNLNFRLLEGIDEFPARVVKLLRSGCLRSRLLRSLSTDREFWDSHNGVKGLKKLVQVIEKRAQLLLNYIQEKDIKLVHD
ncbi:Golgi-associated kinase 1A isoform X2 [Mobula hypostoma]|uniref:Golgi-associated kinase 1A isoform X2 n=1 Tax=Mobula hypostoma TaxID=723540 RepID=UPI002FC376CC